MYVSNLQRTLVQLHKQTRKAFSWRPTAFLLIDVWGVPMSLGPPSEQVWPGPYGGGVRVWLINGIMGSGHKRPPHEQTDMTENITFPNVCWRAVKKNQGKWLLINFITLLDEIRVIVLSRGTIYRRFIRSTTLHLNLVVLLILTCLGIFIKSHYQLNYCSCFLSFAIDATRT